MLLAELVRNEAGLILVGAFILGEEVAVPAAIDEFLDDFGVGDGGLFEVLVHVVELGVAAVDVLHQRAQVGGVAAGAAVLGHAGHGAAAVGGVPLVLEGAEVDVQTEPLGVLFLNEFHIVGDHLAGQSGGDVDFGAHTHVVFLGVGQSHLDELSPVFHGGQGVVNDAQLGAQNGEAQLVGDAEVLNQHFQGLFSGQRVVLVTTGVNPVAVFHGGDVISLAQFMLMVFTSFSIYPMGVFIL